MQASASEILESLDINSWPGPCSAEIVPNAVDSLESGKLLYAPRLHFELSESECRFLSLECPWEFLSGAEPGAGMGLGCGDDGIPPRDVVESASMYCPSECGRAFTIMSSGSASSH